VRLPKGREAGRDPEEEEEDPNSVAQGTTKLGFGVRQPKKKKPVDSETARKVNAGILKGVGVVHTVFPMQKNQNAALNTLRGAILDNYLHSDDVVACL